jgi:hypothetical protein
VREPRIHVQQKKAKQRKAKNNKSKKWARKAKAFNGREEYFSLWT